MKKNTKVDMLSGSIYKGLISMAIPIMIMKRVRTRIRHHLIKRNVSLLKIVMVRLRRLTCIGMVSLQDLLLWMCSDNGRKIVGGFRMLFAS